MPQPSAPVTPDVFTLGARAIPVAASLGLTPYSQADSLGSRYKSVWSEKARARHMGEPGSTETQLGCIERCSNELDWLPVKTQNPSTIRARDAGHPLASTLGSSLDFAPQLTLPLLPQVETFSNFYLAVAWGSKSGDHPESHRSEDDLQYSLNSTPQTPNPEPRALDPKP